VTATAVIDLGRLYPRVFAVRAKKVLDFAMDDVTVWTSADGESWTKRGSERMHTHWYYTNGFKPTPVRYVKVRMNKRYRDDYNRWLMVTEVEVWNHEER